MSTSTVSKPAPTGTASQPAKAAPAAASTAAPAAAKPKRVSKVDPNETPEQQFKRLVEPRVGKALKVAKALKNLSRLKPTDAHREKVFTAIRNAFTLAETAWKGQVATDEGFKI